MLQLATCLLISASLLSQDAPVPAGPPAPGLMAADRDGRRTLGRLPRNLLRGTMGMFSRDGRNPALIGSAATVLGSFFDTQVENQIADPGNRFAQSIGDIAGGLPSGLAVAGVFATSRLAGNQRFRSVGYDLLDASMVNGLWTTALKQAVKRPRPDGTDKLSFPSGHASNAFALATVVERHYGWKAGLPMYALASTVAVSRVRGNRHHLSDVLAGATLGYAVGRSVVRVNNLPLDSTRAPQVSAMPIWGLRTRGLEMRLTW